MAINGGSWKINNWGDWNKRWRGWGDWRIEYNVFWRTTSKLFSRTFYTYNYLVKLRFLFFFRSSPSILISRFNLLSSRSKLSGNFIWAKDFSQFIKETSLLLSVFIVGYPSMRHSLTNNIVTLFDWLLGRGFDWNVLT